MTATAVGAWPPRGRQEHAVFALKQLLWNCDSEACSAWLGACVPHSEPAGSPDAYAEFTPNDRPPFGYSVFTTGCAVATSGGTNLTVEPFVIVTETPSVTLQTVVMPTMFGFDVDGVLRGSGYFGAGEMLLGTTSAGMAAGSSRSRLIPPSEVPPGVPGP